MYLHVVGVLSVRTIQVRRLSKSTSTSNDFVLHDDSSDDVVFVATAKAPATAKQPKVTSRRKSEPRKLLPVHRGTPSGECAYYVLR